MFTLVGAVTVVKYVCISQMIFQSARKVIKGGQKK